MKAGTIAVALVAVAALAAVAALGDRTVRPSIRDSSGSNGSRGVPSGSRSGLTAPCPPGALPDDGVCIPVPAAPLAPDMGLAISLRAGRETDYARYELPVPGAAASSVEPNAGPKPGALTTSSGLSINAKPGTPVSVLTLAGQDGPARAVYSGPLVGDTVVTLHTVKDHDRPREYLVVLGNLIDPPSFAPHSEANRKTRMGVVGTLPLYVDVRLVRSGTDVWALPPDALEDDANTIAVDPRNVLRRLP